MSKKQRYDEEARSEARSEALTPLTPLEYLKNVFMARTTSNDTARYFMPQIVLHILSFLFFFEDYESEGHLVKSSISFEFDERILQVQPVPNSTKVVIVTTNGLYVYVCEGKRYKLIMRNETSLSKVQVPFTQIHAHGFHTLKQMDVWKVLPSHFVHCKEDANRKIEFVTSDGRFLLQCGHWLTLNHLDQSGTMIALSDRYLCPSLFAAMGDKVFVLGMEDGVLYLDILTIPIHSFKLIKRIKLDFKDKPDEVDGSESPRPCLEEWSSWSFNDNHLIMCSEDGRLYILQPVRNEQGDVSLELVFQQKTHHVYYDVDLSEEDMAVLCCNDSESGTGLLYVNLAPLAGGNPPDIVEGCSCHFNDGVPSGEERQWINFYEKNGGEVRWLADGTIDHEDEFNQDNVSVFFYDNVDVSGTSVSVSKGKHSWANAQGTVCVVNSNDPNDPNDPDASKRLFLGNEKHLTESYGKCQTKTAVELGMCTTRLNGWEYDTLFVHNGREVSIIYMLAHVPEPDVRALENGIRMLM
jgi:hypothetical protein